MAKAKCTVVFEGGHDRPAAILYARDGRALNAMNYPRGTMLTAKERARARKRLMKGCAELSRGGSQQAVNERYHGLRGDKREPPPVYHERKGPPPGVPIVPGVLKGRKRRR